MLLMYYRVKNKVYFINIKVIRVMRDVGVKYMHTFLTLYFSQRKVLSFSCKFSSVI